MFQGLKQLIKTIDKFLFIVPVLLSLLGILIISSATLSFGSIKYVIVQAVAFLLGLVLMLIMAAMDYESFGGKTGILYAVNILLLTVVLFLGTGEDVGTKGWIRFAGIGIQPSELVKVGFILTFAKHVSRNEAHVNSLMPFLGIMLHAAVIIGMILLQPDYGTSMVYIFIVLSMLFVAGIYYRTIFAALAVFTASLPIVWLFVLRDFQKKRILTFFNPEMDQLGSGYHVTQSKIAIGSGELSGRGLFSGPQTQLEILPAKQTDFIYAVIGEELGFIVCIIVVIALISLVIKCFSVGMKARTKYGKYICIGVGAMILFQTFENIGMCIGVMPVTGIPLPFLSYGGSSMITNMIAIGLVMSVAARQKSINFR